MNLSMGLCGVRRVAFAAIVGAVGAAGVGACGSDSEPAADARSADGEPDARPRSGQADAAVSAIDASSQADVDAASSSALGQVCSGSGQGSCPDGYFCAEIVGFDGRWCTRPCDGIDDTSCNTDFPGPGFAACRLNLRDGAGGAVDVCLILCDGEEEDCPSNVCSGLCPPGLVCTRTNAPAGYSACL